MAAVHFGFYFEDLTWAVVTLPTTLMTPRGTGVDNSIAGMPDGSIEKDTLEKLSA
jgi:hypothetical protein